MVQFKKQTQETPDFRDNPATIDIRGKRIWVYARKPRGRFTFYRIIVGLALLAFFFAAPFIRVNGQPFMLFNFMDRQFILFGVQFWPQDFQLFFLGMIALMVFIILFTVVYGRIWCGWACPQTIFMELVFRRIEYWIEGDSYYQKQLDKQPWILDKIARKTLKHAVFFAFSFIVGNTFLIYLVGQETWTRLVTDPPGCHLAGLAGMLAFSGVFYFIFSSFREQVCSMVCPYGRLQGVLLDRNSIVISYDRFRGEPRGTFFKGEDRLKAGKGDCINCTQCIQVCPAGIDIRNGTQLECINCACCIDACNAMMKAVDQPRGLIRYASESMISEKKRWKLSLRTAAYSTVLVILLGLITWSMVTRESLEATVLRAPGMLYQEPAPGKISNLYHMKLVNKTTEDMPVSIKLLSPAGEISIIGNPILAKKQTAGDGVFFIILDKSKLSSDYVPVKLAVYGNGRLIGELESTFVGPQLK